MTATLLTVLLPLDACTAPPEAPTELSDLSRYLFREWEAEDPAVLEAGIRNLRALLAGMPLDGELADRAFSLADLEDADVAGVTHPEDAVAGCVPVGVAHASPWDVELHARLATEEDQTPTEPTAEVYDRSFLEPEDPACFPGAGCALLRTFNLVRRKTLLYTVDMELWKDFRWVDVVDGDGEPTGRRAMLARAWLQQGWDAESGGTRIVQSYAVDAWIGAGEGVTWRWQALWSESRIPGVDDEEIVASTIRRSIDEVFEAGDAAVEDLYGATQ